MGGNGKVLNTSPKESLLYAPYPVVHDPSLSANVLPPGPYTVAPQTVPQLPTMLSLVFCHAGPAK